LPWRGRSETLRLNQAEEMGMDAIKSELLMEIRLEAGAPVSGGATSQGERRFVVVTGGRFEGPRLKGEVVHGGSDAIWIEPNGAPSWTFG
jgi:hypothetical protein